MKFKFSYLMLVIALTVAGCAGYFSVWGLSQLFAGASTAVIIMASILEVGKIITTTALHNYWSKLAKGLRIYLTISVGVLMIITSAGIYGFLSNAYQKTANKLEIHEGELSILDSKKTIFEKKISDNEKIILTKNKRIDQLTNLRNNQETRLDSAKTNRAKNNVRNDIELATKEIQKLSNDIDEINIKNATLSDSINKYNVNSLELKSNSDVAGEVGPLKYIAELTGLPMGKVVNYLILLLIFVFDPLAIALILITNRVFQLQGQDNPMEQKKEIEISTPIQEIDESINDGVSDGVNDGVNEQEVKEEIIEQELQAKPIQEPKKEIENRDEKEQKETFREYINKKAIKIEEDRVNYTELLKTLFNNGHTKFGQELPSYNEFIKMVDLEKYSNDVIKRFLTLINYLEISKVSGETKKALMSYEDAQDKLNNYLSLNASEL